MKKIFIKILCFFGIHTWKKYGEGAGSYIEVCNINHIKPKKSFNKIYHRRKLM